MLKTIKKKYFFIIDIQGLFDSDKEDNDEKHLEKLKGLIYKESLKIKGFLYSSNFQKELFDISGIKSLIKYNFFYTHKFPNFMVIFLENQQKK